jgi:MFS family permease
LSCGNHFAIVSFHGGRTRPVSPGWGRMVHMGNDWQAPEPASASAVGPGDGFSQPTYHQHHPDADQPYTDPPPADLPNTDLPHTDLPHTDHVGGVREPRPASIRPQGTGSVTVTRAVVARSRYFSKLVAHKVISASQADGARESGLTAMIWNQVMSYGADAMVTVALAGTVFFSAPSEAQRGNVLLYLLMTMAPFAIVAPVIGPALDRVQHGRRWVMAGTAIGRGVLAVVMAQNFTDLYVLFPAALGSLVLSKAYAVIRSAAAPRLVPSNLTLVEANARLSIFGLAAAIVGGGIVGVAIKVTGSYPLGLWITAAAFGATAFYSFRLPRIVDALPPDASRPDDPSDPLRETTRTALKPAKRSWGRRLLNWARRGFSQPAILALQGESTLRWLSGFITIFLAFYIESVSHGWQAVASLGAMGAATGVGNFAGTGIGTRLKMARPDLIILACNALAAVACLITAVFFSLALAIVACLLAALSNALAKLSLDAVIQRDVAESLRSSAFGRSETFLQLSWVLGATIALLLPPKNGELGFIVAAALTVLVAVFMGLRERAVRAARHTPPPRSAAEVHPGNLGT